MKLLYLSAYKRLKRAKEYGVTKKIETQKKQFEKAGIEVKMVAYTDRTYSLGKVKVLPGGTCEKVSNMDKYDAVYIRFAYISLGMIRFVRKYKRQNPNGRVLLEIPTYPYKDEICSLQGRIYYYFTQMGLFFLHYYLDRLVLISSGYTSVMGVPAINIRNFVDYDAINVRKPSDNTDAIHVICVASFADWHGYDRLLEGLKNYVSLPNHEKIVIHMVGSLKNAHKLGLTEFVKKHHLEKNVIFHNTLTGEKLDEVYSMCDLACCALGIHRKGLRVSSELKSHEYAAKGVPMLTSSNLDTYNVDTAAYICRFPANETFIDFEKVIRFYHGIYDGKNKQDVAHEIRNCFKKYCIADECFRSVVQYIKNDKT